MDGIDVLKYKDFDDIVNYYVDKFSKEGKTICLISNKHNVESTVIELFSYQETSIDEMYLFESDLPLLVGIDKDAKIYVDDIEDENYLNYDVVLIDMDNDYDFTYVIDNCTDNEIKIVMFGKEEKKEIKKNVDEEGKSIDIIIDGEDYNTEIHMYDSEGLDIDGILSFVDMIFG